LLKESSAQVRISSACALGNLGPAAEVVPALVEALDDAEGEVHRYAAFALMRQGGLAEPAVTKLIDRLNDEHMGYMATTALGEIGPAAKRSIPGRMPLC
jgi:HEAT repeat protein